MKSDRDTWLCASEAARELGVRQTTLVTMIETGEIPAEETSAGIVLVRRADVERFRERVENTPEPAAARLRLQHV